MTVLHLVRHGETVWHADNRYAGTSDIALTDRGRDQAVGLVRWAERNGSVDRVVASPLSRARLTAEPAASALGLPLAIDDRLREASFGRGEGMTREEMREEFPSALAAFLAEPASSPLPGGEPGQAVAARALSAFADLRDDPAIASALVVFHTTTLRLALCALLGLPLDEYRFRFPRVGNVTVTTVELGSEGPLAGSAGLLAFNVALPGD